MIDPKELRIGNLVFIDNYSIPEIPMVVHTALKEFLHLKEIGSNLIFSHPCSRAHPIPITHEWLKRMGFIESDKIYSYQTSEQFYIDWTIEDGICLNGIYDDIMSNGDKLGHIKYIHQLQNLYHALTGDELTLNH